LLLIFISITQLNCITLKDFPIIVYLS